MSESIPGLGAPLRTVYCIGRNYAEHAKELGSEVPKSPLVFLKPASALLLDGGVLKLPDDSRRVDHEVEVVAGLCGDGKIRYAIGIDFTCRDIQAAAKKAGEPWTYAKGRRGFAAIGSFVDAQPPFGFHLSVNGRPRQAGDTKDMVFPIERLLAYVGETYGLGPGDVVYTGTPVGVAPLNVGDVVEAELLGTASRLRLACG